MSNATEPKPIIEIKIHVMSDGKIQFTGPLHDPLACLEILSKSIMILVNNERQNVAKPQPVQVVAQPPATEPETPRILIPGE